jgi:hypothetical protein
MMNAWLSEDEVIDLTGYKIPSRQLAFLQRLHIAATMRRNNTVLVLRRDLMAHAEIERSYKAPKLNFA